MTGALIRNRLRATLNRFRALESSERLRLALIVGLVALVLSHWSAGLLQSSLDLGGTEVPGAIRIVAYRLGAFLASIIGFSSFSTLWRSQDIEVLNRLPLPPRALLSYRLVLVLFQNLPFYLLSVVAFLPLLWQNLTPLAIEASIYLTLVYLLTSICGLGWHIFTGHSVVTPAYAELKRRLAGSMILPDRTLLLYSPVLAAATGFLLGLLALTGLSALARGQVMMGMAGIICAIVPGVIVLRRARLAFDRSYYQALAALADGELLGEVGESAPGPTYLGAWYTQKLPAALQPLVARDLRQAWRRNRLDHMALLTTTVALALFALNRGARLAESGWLWPSLWLLVVVAAGQAFRLTRPSSDAPWLWLTLPLPTRHQYLGRLGATLFFPLMILPGLVLAAGWSGQSWGISGVALLLTGVGASVAAANLALLLFTQRRLAGILYLGIVGLALVISRRDPLLAGLWLILLAGLTVWPLRQLSARLADAEQAR